MVTKFSAVSMGSGREMMELLRRPNLTPDDADAIASQAPSLRSVDIVLGRAIPTLERVYYQSERSKQISVLGSTANYPDVFHVEVVEGRFFTPGETRRQASVIILGQTVSDALFPHVDPIGKRVRLGDTRYTVTGVLGPTPSAGGFNMGQDDMVVIPHTIYAKQFGVRAQQMFDFGGDMRMPMLVAVPRDGVDQDVALADIERVLRIRHRLRARRAQRLRDDDPRRDSRTYGTR